MVNGSFRLSDSLYARLEAVARRRGTTKSAVAREALEWYLVNSGRVRRGAFLDIARKFVGCIEGPGDLSFNEKYMEDFGR